MIAIQNILTFVLVLGVLVFFHELGHFLFAKLFKMYVEEFAFGFMKKLVRLGYDGQTEYTIRALPLGGFVRIRGMEIEDGVEQRLTGGEGNAHEDQAAAAGYETTNEALMNQEAAEVSGVDPDGFNNRPIYQRFLVIAGGPAFSFLLGWLVLCSIGFTFGLPDEARPLPVIAQMTAGDPADKAGLKPGDRFLEIDGKPVKAWNDVLNGIRSSPGKPIKISVQTDGKSTAPVRTVTVVPKSVMEDGKTIGQIGIGPDIAPDAPTHRVGIGESFAAGNRIVGNWFTLMGKLVASGAIKDNVGGPITIFRATQQASRAGGGTTMLLVGQLSLSLGLFNLFPIPILDGGHLALMLLEGIRRRKLTAHQTALVFNTGLAIIVVLFVAVMFKDILRLFGRG